MKEVERLQTQMLGRAERFDPHQAYVTAAVYPETKEVVLRIDDRTNPMFWAELSIPAAVVLRWADELLKGEKR